jgi:hypothetical protein
MESFHTFGHCKVLFAMGKPYDEQFFYKRGLYFTLDAVSTLLSWASVGQLPTMMCCAMNKSNPDAVAFPIACVGAMVVAHQLQHYYFIAFWHQGENRCDSGTAVGKGCWHATDIVCATFEHACTPWCARGMVISAALSTCTMQPGCLAHQHVVHILQTHFGWPFPAGEASNAKCRKCVSDTTMVERGF